ncbi:hypothetical protein [Aestuariivivens sediminicola]|uniref:hypothetical protein n=1 Tax=Aestuariivivens sediminicola TaxID=2913560 RepID=UPI001F58EA8E|nr:hypothetical protein [Aestuariivivens sediminicola]
MKNLLLICAIAYTTNSFSQKSNDSKLLTKQGQQEFYSFKPSKKLLNEEIWTRVSNTRFECNFLRLAVEYQDYEYVLYEMDEPKRELSRAPDYKTIGEEIAMNTFRVTPYLGSNATASVND